MQSIQKKRWKFLDDPDSNITQELAKETKIPFPITKILIRRGITDKAAAKKFFIPEIKNLYDPFLMKGMEKAVERLIKVIKDNERIMVFGDYDVDGTSGVSLFYRFMKNFGLTPLVYIPDRFTDGYGLSFNGIEQAAKENIKLIVAIDCGITAFDKVEHANSLGVEIIICDHHQPPDNIPNAYAVLDALQSDCNYPFKGLCGTGVAFKLIQAVCIRLGINFYMSLLDYVAIATAADMVPVVDENRILVHNGFKQIMRKPRPSIQTLINNSGFKTENINTSNVVFSLGPRINAVGRLGDANRAVEFLTCEEMDKAHELAKVLESENTNRKKIDSEIYLQAQDTYESYITHIEDPNETDVAIILHNPEWHPGVLGIIASRMVEKYYKPSIILTNFNGTAKGSARSVSNFNIYEALKQCSDEFNGLIQFGGHYHAAGIEIEVAQIDEFRKIFNRIAKDMMSQDSCSEEILTPELIIDSELNLDEINLRFAKIIKHMEPFGPGNMNPLFASFNVQVVGEPRVYNNSTWVFKVRKSQSNENGYYDRNVIECVYFNPDLVNLEDSRISMGKYYDIVYSVEENNWNNRTKIQLRIRDIRNTEV